MGIDQSGLILGHLGSEANPPSNESCFHIFNHGENQPAYQNMGPPDSRAGTPTGVTSRVPRPTTVFKGHQGICGTFLLSLKS